MKTETIWKFPEHNERVEMCYTKESMRHPAKMHLQLCREIIKLYSKEGDLILDCMCGIGTTIIEGMLLNRNVIGIEYEQKFVDMAQKNIDKINKIWNFTKHGKGVVIKGDSRELVKLLQNRGRLSASEEAIYSQNPDNIGNMKYGNPDIIITSPPYAHESSKTRGDKERTDKWAKELSLLNQDNYSDDPLNCRNLKGQTYLEAMLLIYQQCFFILKPKYIKNPSFWIINYWKKHKDAPRIQHEDVLVFRKSENATHTHQGINAIITSPPYAETLSKGTDKSKFGNRGNWNIEEKYSNNPVNIGNLPYSI